VWLPIGFVLKFYQGVSKIWRIDITQCFVDKRHPPIDYPISDIFQEMSRQWPIDWPVDKFGPHPMFFHAKPTWKYCDDAWFATAPMGQTNYVSLLINWHWPFLIWKTKWCLQNQERCRKFLTWNKHSFHANPTWK